MGMFDVCSVGLTSCTVTQPLILVTALSYCRSLTHPLFGTCGCGRWLGRVQGRITPEKGQVVRYMDFNQFKGRFSFIQQNLSVVRKSSNVKWTRFVGVKCIFDKATAHLLLGIISIKDFWCKQLESLDANKGPVCLCASRWMKAEVEIVKTPVQLARCESKLLISSADG